MSGPSHTFVLGKASALAKRIKFEPNKKAAAHIICDRLLTLLKLSQGARHAR